MAEHLITVIKMVSTATYSASSPSQLSRHPWQLCKRDGGTGDLLRSTVSMHAVSVNNATITSHGCDAQNFPCARNNCAVIFDVAVCVCVCMFLCLNWTKVERENRATKINTKKLWQNRISEFTYYLLGGLCWVRFDRTTSLINERITRSEKEKNQTQNISVGCSVEICFVAMWRD